MSGNRKLSRNSLPKLGRIGQVGGLLAAAAVLALAQPGLAASIPGGVDTGSVPTEGETGVTLGLGGGIAPDYEGSEDYKAVPMWILNVSNLYDPNTYVRLAGPTLRSNFVPHPQLRAGLFGQYVPERDDVDNDRVDDLDNTDLSLLLGATVGWDLFPQPDLMLAPTLDFGVDVANGNGYLITPRLSYFNALPDSKFSVTADLFTTYADEDYMEEYFGIGRGASARSGLDTYDPDADFKDFGFTITTTYSITDHWSTTLAGQYKRILGDAEDSPIVSDEGDENQLAAVVTLNYKF